MCYKDEVQRKNEDKLKNRFEEDNVPQFIQKYIMKTRKSNSMATCLNNWIAIKDMLLWMIDNDVIMKADISSIEPEDFKYIESQDVSNYLQYKEDHGMSPSTLETRKNVFRGFWNRMVESNICPIENNIITSVDYVGVTNSNNIVKKMPTEQQLSDMVDKINKKKDDFVRIRNLCVLRVLKGTGLRESELAGMDLNNLFLEGDEKDSTPYIMILGKGSYRELQLRRVYPTGDACNAIKEFLSIRDCVDGIISTNAVFVNKNGNRLTEDNIKKMFGNYGNGVTPHMIRHLYATIMASKGLGILAQQNLGHTSMNTTVNNYINAAHGAKNILENM